MQTHRFFKTPLSYYLIKDFKKSAYVCVSEYKKTKYQLIYQNIGFFKSPNIGISFKNSISQTLAKCEWTFTFITSLNK